MVVRVSNNLSGSNTGGASSSAPQIFEQNLVAFRKYALKQGAYFDEHGYLVFRGIMLTRADDEYLAQSSVSSEQLFTDDELEDAWLNLLDYAGVGE